MISKCAPAVRQKLKEVAQGQLPHTENLIDVTLQRLLSKDSLPTYESRYIAQKNMRLDSEKRYLLWKMDELDMWLVHLMAIVSSFANINVGSVPRYLRQSDRRSSLALLGSVCDTAKIGESRVAGSGQDPIYS